MAIVIQDERNARRAAVTSTMKGSPTATDRMEPGRLGAREAEVDAEDAGGVLICNLPPVEPRHLRVSVGDVGLVEVASR